VELWQLTSTLVYLDAWLDNEIADLFVWLLQNLVPDLGVLEQCNDHEGRGPRLRTFCRALFRTRTGDPLLPSKTGDLGLNGQRLDPFCIERGHPAPSCAASS
jgi:hypothetical protein